MRQAALPMSGTFSTFFIEASLVWNKERVKVSWYEAGTGQSGKQLRAAKWAVSF